MKRLLATIVAALLLLQTTPVFAAEGYTDVPQDSWAKTYIEAAGNYNLMNGTGDGQFGYGKTLTKAEFATILCNMMQWESVAPPQASFADVTADKWYYSYVETALKNGVMDKTGSFLPDTAITREEMAVMFVRALGLAAAAKLEENSALPFTDVTTNKGYIGVAYQIGMLSGTSPTTFAPKNTAKREEAATMLSRVYEKYGATTEFLHGFYALSSYSQRALTADMDAVTLGWSAMARDDKGVWLNTGSDNGNQFKIPSGYEDIVEYLDGNGTPANLGVYMDSTGGVRELLLSSDDRTAAVGAIVSELTRTYDQVGKNPYSGVTIDFEGLKGSDVKAGFNAFLTELASKLDELDKSLYVTVQPVLSTGEYFDGFDYRTIGQLADKVILMAHDYNPTNLNGYEGTQWYKNTALTPIDQVYWSLKAVVDPATGVADKDKLMLAVSFATLGWEISPEGKLLSATPYHPAKDTVYQRMNQAGTIKGFSETYRNPYIQYMTEDGTNVFLWYEDQQSVAEKAALARMFGISGISLWRLGTIPTESGWNVMDVLIQ